MPSTPWAITKRKRSSTPATAVQPRKRTRLSEPPVTDGRRQQTLTQAQWIPSRPSSFQDDILLRPLESGGRRRSGRRTLKRDSTLTQMDFFGSMALPPEHVDGALLHDANHDTPPMPQIDGAYDSPRKSRPTRSSGRRNEDGLQGMHEESEEYLPQSKREGRSGAIDSAEQSSRRTSRRLTDKENAHKVLSDPANNYEYFERALSGCPAIRTNSKPPVLEIQDSTATDDDPFQLPHQSQRSTRSVAPRTPQRARTIVLSSQTPESLPPTARKSAIREAMFVQSVRSPLRERSINLPSAIASRKQRPRKTSPRRSASKSSKIVSLKLPKQSMPPPNSRIDDSWDIWSLPVSSSPAKKQASHLMGVQSGETRGVQLSSELVRVSSNQPEIPDTSQAYQEASIGQSNEEDLPSLNAIFGLERIASNPSLAEVHHDGKQMDYQSPRPEVAVRDFAQQVNSAAAVSHQSVAIEAHFKTPEKAASTFVADSESDVDSPIANDTQFNEEVAKRTSSPQAASEDSHKTVSTQILSDATNKLKAAAARPLEEEDTADVDEKADELPTPRLIRSSSRPPSREEEVHSDPSSEESLLPPPVMTLAHQTQTQTMRVPLNDTLSSSSPPLQSRRSVTQRSLVRPAALPHLSQMSTQEATQYGMSSMVVHEANGNPFKTERITIKDSSSMRMPISQIPAQRNSQGVSNVDLGLDALDEGDEEEIDLNPPSTSEQEVPVMADAKITRLAAKRRADLALTQSPPRKKRRTPSQTVPTQQIPSSSSEQDFDLDPRSSHHTLRCHRSIPYDAGESQDFTSAAGTTSNANEGCRDTTTTRPTTQEEVDEPEKPTEQPQSSSQQSLASSPPVSSGRPSPLRKDYAPLPDFNNETQSNFTQGGHVSAAYIHRQRDKGVLPAWYTPKPYKVPGYTRR